VQISQIYLENSSCKKKNRKNTGPIC